MPIWQKALLAESNVLIFVDTGVIEAETSAKQYITRHPGWGTGLNSFSKMAFAAILIP